MTTKIVEEALRIDSTYQPTQDILEVIEEKWLEEDSYYDVFNSLAELYYLEVKTSLKSGNLISLIKNLFQSWRFTNLAHLAELQAKCLAKLQAFDTLCNPNDIIAQLREWPWQIVVTIGLFLEGKYYEALDIYECFQHHFRSIERDLLPTLDTTQDTTTDTDTDDDADAEQSIDEMLQQGSDAILDDIKSAFADTEETTDTEEAETEEGDTDRVEDDIPYESTDPDKKETITREIWEETLQETTYERTEKTTPGYTDTDLDDHIAKFDAEMNNILNSYFGDTSQDTATGSPQDTINIQLLPEATFIIWESLGIALSIHKDLHENLYYEDLAEKDMRNYHETEDMHAYYEAEGMCAEAEAAAEEEHWKELTGAADYDWWETTETERDSSPSHEGGLYEEHEEYINEVKREEAEELCGYYPGYGYYEEYDLLGELEGIEHYSHGYYEEYDQLNESEEIEYYS